MEPRKRKPVARPRRCAHLVAMALAAMAMTAQAAQIRGRLLNTDTGKPLAGAQVKVPGSPAAATTDEAGNFVLDNVSAGPHSLVITAAGFREMRYQAVAADGAKPVDMALKPSEAVERILVTGIRAAEIAAVAAKKEADTQVEVVTADEVGKLVDKNVADAVARLPGVTTATDKGEGRYVVIRGLEPSLANVTINNQTSASPEPESRQVKLDDVPAALIGEVTVVKVLTADRDANAIAGQVDIKTLSAFDRPKNFASVRLAGVKGSIHDDKGTEGDATVGGKFGADRQFGAVLAFNRSRRPSYSEDVIGTGDVAWQVINGVEVPESLDQRVYQPAFRTRQGLVGNFDWRPDVDTKAYLRLTQSKFDDEEARQRFRYLFPTSASGYSSLTASGGTIVGSRGERYIRLREEITETRTATAGGEWHFDQDILQLEASRTKATKDDPRRAEFRYRTGSTTLPGTFAFGADLFDLALTDRAYDPARFALNTYRDQFRYAEEDLTQLRADYTWARDAWGIGSFLKFGAKYLDRDKVNDQSGTSYTYSGSGFTLAGAAGNTIPTNYGGRYLFGPTVDYDRSRAFFDANRSAFTVDRANTLADSLAADYAAREKITAAYVMASVVRGNVTIVPGLRVERTEADYKAIAVTDASTVNDTYNSFGSRRYTDWFPSIAAKFDLSRNLIGRVSATTAIGRPDYDKVAPTVSVDVSSNEVTKGNPALEPLKAVNLDASLEYYTPGGGILAGALFYKKIDNPIFISTRTGSGIFAGVPLTDASITEPLNGDRSRLTGLELNYQQPLTFLPSPFDGFGMGVNLTFVTGDTRVPGRSDKLPLIQQAERVANLQLYYEKYGFATRLVYTRRSPVLEFVGEDSRGDVYSDTNATLGIKVSYDVTKQVQVYFEGANLTNEEDYRYAASRNRMVEAERFGRTYRAGISWSY